jgi:hypothetical protein
MKNIHIIKRVQKHSLIIPKPNKRELDMSKPKKHKIRQATMMKTKIFVRFQVLTLVSMKITAFQDIAPCSLVEASVCCLHHQDTLMMEAVHNSETMVYFHETTQCCIPESCQLQEHFCSIEGFISVQKCDIVVLQLLQQKYVKHVKCGTERRIINAIQTK